MAWVLVMMQAVRCFAGGQGSVPITGNHPAYLPADWQPLSGEQVLHLRAVLALRNTDQLTKLEADLQDRDSPRYHRWLTTDQFISRFGPTPKQMKAVADWLSGRGLQVTASDIRTHSVQFSGTAAMVASTFQTVFVGSGHSYANLSDPMVPADLAPTIQVILGLSSREPKRTGGR